MCRLKRTMWDPPYLAYRPIRNMLSVLRSQCRNCPKARRRVGESIVFAQYAVTTSLPTAIHICAFIRLRPFLLLYAFNRPVVTCSRKFADLAARRIIVALCAALSPRAASEGLLRHNFY